MEPQPQIIYHKFINLVDDLSRWELADLEKALHLRKLHLAVAELASRGFSARVVYTPGESNPEYTEVFDMLLISPPDGADSELGEWASLGQIGRLIDIAANLPPAQAFDRWVQGLPLPEPYTRHDAERDRRAELAAARQRYQEGIDNAEDHRLAVRAAADYSELAEPADRNEHLRTIPQLAQEWGVSIRRAQAHVKHLHTKLGVGRKLGNIWVLSEAETLDHRPAESPGRPKTKQKWQTQIWRHKSGDYYVVDVDTTTGLVDLAHGPVDQTYVDDLLEPPTDFRMTYPTETADATAANIRLAIHEYTVIWQQPA